MIRSYQLTDGIAFEWKTYSFKSRDNLAKCFRNFEEPGKLLSKSLGSFLTYLIRAVLKTPSATISQLVCDI